MLCIAKHLKRLGRVLKMYTSELLRDSVVNICMNIGAIYSDFAGDFTIHS